MQRCPVCNKKDFIGIYLNGNLIKMSCLDCDYEKVTQWMEKQHDL